MREAGIFANVLLCGLGLLIAFGLGAVQSSKVWLCEHCQAKRKHFVKFHKCHTHPHTHTFSIAKFSHLAHNFPQVFVLPNKSLTIFSSYGGILVGRLAFALIKLALLVWESSSFFIFLPTLGILALLTFPIAVQYNSRSFEGFFCCLFML